MASRYDFKVLLLVFKCCVNIIRKELVGLPEFVDCSQVKM